MNTVADLIALTPVQDGMLVQTYGYSTSGDGGGGTFRWDAASTTATNTGTVFAISGIPVGRFKRVVQTPFYRPEWFGAKPNDATFDCAPAIAACMIQSTLNNAGTELGNGTYYITQDIGALVTPSLPYNSTALRVRGVATGAYVDITESSFGTTIRRTVETPMFTWEGTDSQIRWGTVFDNVAFHGARFTNSMVRMRHTKDHFWNNSGFLFSSGAAIEGLNWWDSVLSTATFSFTGATNGTIGSIHLVNTNYFYPVPLVAYVANNNLTFENIRAEPANVFLYMDGASSVPLNKVTVFNAKLENHYMQTPMIIGNRIRDFSFGGGRSFMAYGDNYHSVITNGLTCVQINDGVNVRFQDLSMEYAGNPNPTNQLIRSFFKFAGTSFPVVDNVVAVSGYTNSVPSYAFIEVMGTNFPAVLKAKFGNIGYSDKVGPNIVVNGTNISYGNWERQQLIVTNRLDVAGNFGVVPRSGISDTADFYVPTTVWTNDLVANGGNITAFKDTNGLGGTVTANQLVASSTGNQLLYVNSTSAGASIGLNAYSNNISMGGVRYNGSAGSWEVYDKSGVQRIIFPDGGNLTQVPGAIVSVSGNITASSGLLVSSATGDNILYQQTTGAGNVGYGFIRSGAYIFQSRVSGANTWQLIGTNSTIVLSSTPTGAVSIPVSVNVGSGTTMTQIKHGRATLVAGTVTVADASVTANSRIFVCGAVDGGTPGWLRVSARSAGASFTIQSSSGTDTSQVDWLLINP